MKKLTALLLILFAAAEPVFAVPSTQKAPDRALFVSVIEEFPVLSDRKQILRLVEFADRAKIQTLFVQVYRSNKAWFRSDTADDAPYRQNLQKVGEDPIALLIREAHARGIQVHAWLNLFSLSGNVHAPLLTQYGPEVLTRNALPKTHLADYRIDNQYFLEPGDPRVTDAISTIVGEVVRAYPDLDGIQFDYIRYPDWKPMYGRTAINEQRFLESTGLEASDISEQNPAWQNWKRQQVTGFVERLAGEARALHPGLVVSTTGLVPYSRANLEAYQDWKTWVERGTIDFVTLMCYAPDEDGFERYIHDAKRQFGTLEKVNLAVGAYRFGGAPQIFENQWDQCEASGNRACAAFFYGNLYEHPHLARVLLDV